MQLKSLALLFLAAALVMGQEEQPQRGRQRQLAANRRNKLIEEAQSNRATSPVVAPKPRIVSRTRVTTAAPLRASLRSTDVPTTTTEAVIATETTSFDDFNADAPQEPAREEVQRPEIQPEPQEEVIRGTLPSRPGFRDGSFQDEIRSIDCVVHGRYGYIEEDGTRHEFTYQTGEPCDPKTAFK